MAGTTALVAALTALQALPASAVTTTHEAITYSSDRDGDTEIHRQDADGTLRNLTTNRTSDYGAVWSPDGKRLAFASKRNGTHDLYVMGLDGNGLRKVSGDARLDDVFPKLTADGQRLVFSTFASQELGRSEDVWSVKLDGSDRRRLTSSSANEFGPDANPKG